MLQLGNGKVLMETERLIIREFVQGDYGALCRILCDGEVMRAAYEGAFSLEEAQNWLNRHFARYENLGFGLWAVVCKETGEMIGQCGLTLQGWRDREVLEIGYLFQKAHWHKGYATEAAVAVKNMPFPCFRRAAFIRLCGIPIRRRKGWRCGMGCRWLTVIPRAFGVWR